MVKICGIDEAGRGPVIGPMVICGVLIDDSKLVNLKNIGVKDSKLLTALKRERIAESIEEISKKYKLIEISPKEIDNHVLGDDSNLNNLEMIKIADIINFLDPDIAYVDSPSPNLVAYQNALSKLLKIKCKVVCAHKADTKYEVVGAASILAKVKRDAEVLKIKKKIGIDFGSGYPADPKTTEFLKNNFDKYKDIFRKSWSSYSRLVSAKKQKNLGEF